MSELLVLALCAPAVVYAVAAAAAGPGAPAWLSLPGRTWGALMRTLRPAPTPVLRADPRRIAALERELGIGERP